MATERQIDANRVNAQLSTGPRTDQGKAASSRNSTTHSLTAKGLIILPGQEQAFTQIESDLRSTLLPAGPLQEIIFTRALESAWTLQRCRFATTTIYEFVAKTKPAMDPMVDNENEARYSRIQRYAREAERSMYKAMHELGKLQEEARYRQQAFPLTPAQSENAEQFAETPHALSQVCSFNQIMRNIVNNCRVGAKTNRLHVAAAPTTPNVSDPISRIEANPVTATLAAAA